MNPSLLPFLKPNGVVLVGASTSPEKLGYGIARNLAGSGYSGPIYFVGQKPGELFGKRLVTDLGQVPDPVELAVLAVPNIVMPEALRACARRGICAAILVSSGFREVGTEGAALENECIEIARAHGIRFLGPNCIGTIDTHLPLDTSFLQPPMPQAGSISFISHSGAFCAAIIDWSRQQGFGFAQIVSLGNQTDINETDMLSMVANDLHTRVIALYMEGVSDGRRFVQVAREVTLQKPVVALKVGRSDGARKAAASHTGALAASDTAFEAAFAKTGIQRASSAEQMFDWARALESCPLPNGPNVAVLTDAGGPGVIAADALAANGLALTKLSSRTLTVLAARLPAAASVHNPVDMLASAAPVDYAACLGFLLDDEAVDAALVILPPPPMFSAESVAAAIVPIIEENSKPVVVALMGSELIEGARMAFNDAHIVTYPFPEQAASALGVLARRAAYLRQQTDTAFIVQQRSTQSLISFVNSTPEEIVASYGITTAPVRLAHSSDEAVSFARALGLPVVLKIASPEIVHKSDVGGVVLNVETEAAVRSAYAQVMKTVQASQPKATIEGIRVQHQVPDGQEIIIGVTQDPSFGPLIMFGSGGLEAEGLKDVAFALAPLSAGDADELMHRTWAGRRLAGFRNIAAGDSAAVRDALIRLSLLAYEHPEVKEIEINPLRVHSKGAIALDVRMVR